MQILESYLKRKKNRLLLSVGMGFATYIILPMLLITLLVVIIGGALGANDIDNMRALEIPGEYLYMARQAADQNKLDFIRLLVLSTKIAGYQKENFNDETLKQAVAAINDIIGEEGIEATLYDIYKKSYETIKVSPIPKATEFTEYTIDPETGKKSMGMEYTKTWRYSHYDDFGAGRYYKGERTHKGNDLIADKGVPIVSMTDGTITRLGWNELGGWRVGVTDANGTYWYYAHMDHYAPVHQGQYVTAGTVLGYVGNTGYGPPGTSGKFIDHLHLQIGIKSDEMADPEEEYTWVNPYPIVVYMEHYRIIISEKVRG